MRGTGGLKMELSAEQLSLIANSYAMEKRAVMEKYDMTSIEVDVMLFLANNPSLNKRYLTLHVQRWILLLFN